MSLEIKCTRDQALRITPTAASPHPAACESPCVALGVRAARGRVQKPSPRRTVGASTYGPLAGTPAIAPSVRHYLAVSFEATREGCLIVVDQSGISGERAKCDFRVGFTEKDVSLSSLEAKCLWVR